MLNEVAFDESPETNVTAPKPFMYDAIATVLFEHALSNFKTTLQEWFLVILIIFGLMSKYALMHHLVLVILELISDSFYKNV